MCCRNSFGNLVRKVGNCKRLQVSSYLHRQNGWKDRQFLPPPLPHCLLPPQLTATWMPPRPPDPECLPLHRLHHLVFNVWLDLATEVPSILRCTRFLASMILHSLGFSTFSLASFVFSSSTDFLNSVLISPFFLVSWFQSPCSWS